MTLQQPGPQFIQRRVLLLGDMRRDRCVQPGQHTRRVRTLRPCRYLAGAFLSLPRLDDIRDADPEPRRRHACTTLRRQDPIAQVLRIRLSSPPNHPSLRHMPEADESHITPAPEPPIAIPARVKPL